MIDFTSVPVIGGVIGGLIGIIIFVVFFIIGFFSNLSASVGLLGL